VDVEFEISYRHLWFGLYWETWPEPFRRDVWIAIPFLALHITKVKK
jgi:hypothetical protein